MQDSSIAEMFSAGLKFVKVGEKLIGLAAIINFAAKAASEVAECDPELTPELTAILQGLDAAADATQRAITFIDARLGEVRR